MITKEKWIERLYKMKKNLYYDGQIVGRDHEQLTESIQTIGVTFDAAFNPETKDLCTATSHLTGETINRFSHVHQNVDDLHKKQDMTRMLTREVGFCIGRCMGADAINAINAVSFEADKANGGKTEYYKNFTKWLTNFHKEDLTATCAQTDVKGERLKRPGEQTDPDQYLHVVERRADGIVVRGCKLHISNAAVVDEILVLPTRALMENEKDYAVAFAIPGDWEGVKQIIDPHNVDRRKHFKRQHNFGLTDSYVIFDDVFVPWERVFLCGEHLLGGVCALLFALFHRHSYSGCKPAVGDMMTGLAALAAEINGIEKESHVKEKLAELIMTAELGYAAGYTASDLGKPEVYIPGFGQVPFGPGSCIPNAIYCNVGRCLTGEAMFHEQEILAAIAGGIPATLPHESDLASPELKKYIDKYLNRNAKFTVEDQIRFWLYYTDMACSKMGAVFNYGGYHGGGSPIMEQIAITSQYDIKLRKNLVRKTAGMTIKK